MFSALLIIIALACAPSSQRTVAALGITAAIPTLRLDLPIGGSLQATIAVALLWAALHIRALLAAKLTPVHIAIMIGTAGMVLTSFLGPFVNSMSLAATLSGLALTSTVVARLARRHDALLVRSFVATCTVGCAVAVLQVFGFVAAELVHQDISQIGRPSGWFGEPDWLGLFAALTIGACLSYGHLGRALRLSGLLFGASALILSFARAAWIALAVAVLAALISRRKSTSPSTIRKRTFKFLGATCIGMLILFALSAPMRTDLTRRSNSLLGGGVEDVSAQAREHQRDSMFALAQAAPWYGGGLSASGRVGVSGRLLLDGESSNNVGSNWLLSLWVDGKILAIPLVAAVLVCMAHHRARVQPHWTLLMIVLVSSLASNAFYFAVTWLLIGLLTTRRTKAPAMPTLPKRSGFMEPPRGPEFRGSSDLREVRRW